MTDIPIFLTLRKSVKLTKWKVEEGTIIYDGRVLLLYEETDGGKSAKLKSKNVGTVSKLLVKEGDIVNPGDALLEIAAGCSHPTVINDLCAECGADLQKEGETESRATVPMVHSIPQLKVSQEQAQKLGHKDTERLLRDRKLVLLVDLDQTLIHTTHDNIPNNLKDVHHFQLAGSPNPWYHTRLRPGTDQFLLNMSRLFELHICTFGVRPYAHTVAAILDRDRRLFSNRILSRDEFFDPNSKFHNLQALFPCGDELVCIIDDREDVWDNSPNLIQVKPYQFFAVTGEINDILSRTNHIKDNSYLAPGVIIKEKRNKFKKAKNSSDHENKEEEIKSDEEELNSEYSNEMIDFEDEDDYLLHLEDILTRVHKRFYNIYDKKEKGVADVKWVIEQERSSVLRGCILVLSGLVPIPQDGVTYECIAPAAKIAIKLGAKLAQDLSCETTHLVAANRTAKVHQAQKLPHIKVVNPQWLASCAHRWEKVDEALFQLGNGGPLPFLTKIEKRPLSCPEHPLVQQEAPAFLNLSQEDMDAMNQEIEDDSEGGETDKEDDGDIGTETTSQSGSNSDEAEGGDDAEEWSELGREIEKGLSDCL